MMQLFWKMPELQPRIYSVMIQILNVAPNFEPCWMINNVASVVARH
jgi:hypothetical protein